MSIHQIIDRQIQRWNFFQNKSLLLEAYTANALSLKVKIMFLLSRWWLPGYPELNKMNYTPWSMALMVDRFNTKIIYVTYTKKNVTNWRSGEPVSFHITALVAVASWWECCVASLKVPGLILSQDSSAMFSICFNVLWHMAQYDNMTYHTISR